MCNSENNKPLKVRKMKPLKQDGTRSHAAKQKTKQLKRIRKAMA